MNMTLIKCCENCVYQYDGMFSLDRAGIARLPQWEDALERYLMELR